MTFEGARSSVAAAAVVASHPDAHQYGLGLRGVDGVRRGDVWAVGYPSTDGTLIEHWDGSAWTRSDNPQPDGRAGFFDVDARTGNDAWAVGFQDPDGTGLWVPYAQHWDGRRWREVPADPGLATAQANAVDSHDSDDAWLVGEATETAGGPLRPLVEHWDGQQWNAVSGIHGSARCDIALNGVAAIAADDVWAVGTKTCERTEAFIEHWDGARWSRIADPSPKRKSTNLEGVTAISSDDVWMVGSSYRGTKASRTTTLHWDGTRLVRVPSPDPGRDCSLSLESVSGSASADVWAVGSRSCRRGVVPVSLHWDGDRWTAVKSPSAGFHTPSGDGLYGVTALSNRSAFAVGIAKTGAQPPEAGFIEHWNGHRWKLQ
jgi:hypothetical protein